MMAIRTLKSKVGYMRAERKQPYFSRSEQLYPHERQKYSRTENIPYHSPCCNSTGVSHIGRKCSGEAQGFFLKYILTAEDDFDMYKTILHSSNRHDSEREGFKRWKIAGYRLTKLRHTLASAEILCIDGSNTRGSQHIKLAASGNSAKRKSTSGCVVVVSTTKSTKRIRASRNGK